MYIGAHVSTRGGFLKAAERARAAGAGAFQYFSKNPRNLQLKAPDLRDTEACLRYCRTHGLQSIVHTAYVVNPATGMTQGNELYAATVASLRNDLLIAEGCGSSGIVVHFGHLKSADPLTGYKNIIQCLNDVLKDWHGQTKILLENQAGDHGPMGVTMEEMVQIRNLCHAPERIGFCLDTCHAFASGMWSGQPDDEWWNKGETLGYWATLGAVHLNDSRYGAGSLKDRHERVGKGRIGERGLRWLLEHETIRSIPVILESAPGEDGTHQEDIHMLYSWFE